jgi:hypothetical protein
VELSKQKISFSCMLGGDCFEGRYDWELKEIKINKQ